ncbi:MAG: cell division protein FtsL [Gallionella sp.]
MWRSGNGLNIMLLVALVICALSAVSSQHKARRLYLELQKEKDNAQQMDIEWGQLQLELSTWAMPARVERIATQKLRMQLPERGQIRFVELNPAAQGETGKVSIAAESGRNTKADSTGVNTRP